MATRPTTIAPEHDPDIAPHRLLAVSVIEKAISDAQSRATDPQYGEWRQDAIEFLTGGPDLQFWIEVLGADARAVRTLIDGALNGRENGNGAGPKRAKTP